MVDRAGRTAPPETITIVSIVNLSIEHLSLLSCPALQLSTPKEKRSRFSRSNLLRRDHGEQLIKTLRSHQKEFPRFAPYLEQVIAKVLSDSQRTRKGDKELVLKCLQDFNETGLLITEIIEDTGLSHWDVRQILKALEKAGTVEFVPRPPLGIPVKNWRCRPRFWRLKKAKSQTGGN